MKTTKTLWFSQHIICILPRSDRNTIRCTRRTHKCKTQRDDDEYCINHIRQSQRDNGTKKQKQQTRHLSITVIIKHTDRNTWTQIRSSSQTKIEHALCMQQLSALRAFDITAIPTIHFAIRVSSYLRQSVQLETRVFSERCHRPLASYSPDETSDSCFFASTVRFSLIHKPCCMQFCTLAFFKMCFLISEFEFLNFFMFQICSSDFNRLCL